MSKHPLRRRMPAHELEAKRNQQAYQHAVSRSNDGEAKRSSVHVDDNVHVKIDRYFDTEKLIEELKGLEL